MSAKGGLQGMSNIFVCAMGIGTVFVGLISLVFICFLVSKACNLMPTKTPAPKAAVTKSAPANSAEIANKGEIIAAICAAIAEEIGEDVKNIKVVSFKRA